jgi:hypothetical protein
LRRVVIHAIGQVGDHQVRLDAAEHALDVRRDRAIAAEEAVPPEEPQIARPRNRVLGSLRRASIAGVGDQPVDRPPLDLIRRPSSLARVRARPRLAGN